MKKCFNPNGGGGSLGPPVLRLLPPGPSCFRHVSPKGQFIEGRHVDGAELLLDFSHGQTGFAVAVWDGPQSSARDGARI